MPLDRMRRAIFLIILLAVVPIYGQRVRSIIAPRTTGKVRVLMEIPVEGSYAFAITTNLGAWQTLSNFNTLGFTNYFDYVATNKNSFYRLQRLAIGPTITLQPQGTNVYAGSDVTLQSQATGSWPLRLQWYKAASPNPIVLPGETNSTLKITGLVANSGSYSLLASNSWGAVFSSGATVLLSAPVLDTVAARKIHFQITAGASPFITSGTYDMDCHADGSYYTSSTSVSLTDSGYWIYTKWNDTTGYIQIPGSFIYPNATFRLTFETPITGTFLLTDSTSSQGYQSGRFTFTN